MHRRRLKARLVFRTRRIKRLAAARRGRSTDEKKNLPKTSTARKPSPLHSSFFKSPVAQERIEASHFYNRIGV